jgi:hypothetical protein
MKLQNAKEFFEAPPKGRYKLKIMAAEAKLSQKGSPMIALTLEVRSDLNGNTDFAGSQVFDYLITDESFKGAGMAKIKLRGLGVDVEKEQSDEAVVGQLLGREIYADLDVEQGKDKEGKLKWQVDGKTGKQVPLNNNRVIAYFTAPAVAVGATAAVGTPPALGATTAAPAMPKGGFPGFPGAVPNPAAGMATPPFAVPAPTKPEPKADEPAPTAG